MLGFNGACWFWPEFLLLIFTCFVFRFLLLLLPSLSCVWVLTKVSFRAQLPTVCVANPKMALTFTALYRPFLTPDVSYLLLSLCWCPERFQKCFFQMMCVYIYNHNKSSKCQYFTGCDIKLYAPSIILYTFFQDYMWKNL